MKKKYIRQTKKNLKEEYFSKIYFKKRRKKEEAGKKKEREDFVCNFDNIWKGNFFIRQLESFCPQFSVIYC